MDLNPSLAQFSSSAIHHFSMVDQGILQLVGDGTKLNVCDFETEANLNDSLHVGIFLVHAPPCLQVEKTDKFSSGDQKAVADLTAEMISKAGNESRSFFVFPNGFT